MMNKRNSLLLALLCLQLGLLAILSLNDRDGEQTRQHFFAGIEPSLVTGLTILGDEGRKADLRKTEEGWIVSTEGKVPADRRKIDKALKALTALAPDRLVTRTRESHNRFLVGEKKYNLLLTLTLADGREKSLYLGSAPSHKSTHVRAEGDERVYLAREFSAWDFPLEASAWWLSDYVDLPDESLAEVRIENSAGSLHLKKGEQGVWLPAGQAETAVDQARAQALVDAARRITLNEYLGREEKSEYGLMTPAARLTLAGKGKETTLLIGAPDPVSNTAVLKSSDSPFYVRASSGALADLLAASPEGLLRGEREGGQAEPGE